MAARIAARSDLDRRHPRVDRLVQSRLKRQVLEQNDEHTNAHGILLSIAETSRHLVLLSSQSDDQAALVQLDIFPGQYIPSCRLLNDLCPWCQTGRQRVQPARDLGALHPPIIGGTTELVQAIAGPPGAPR